MESKNCLICHKLFYKSSNRSKRAWSIAKFCSMKCFQIHWKQTTLVEIKQKDSQIILQCDYCKKDFKNYLSNIKPNKHKFCSIECRSQWMSESRKGWYGKKSYYKNLHIYINKIKGKAIECTECGVQNLSRYHWANISGEYKRDSKDYKALCPTCHYKFDLKENYLGGNFG